MPQIELMLTDLPHTLYKSATKEAKYTESDIDEATRLQEEANRRARERRAKKEDDSYTIDEIFNGVAEEEHQ